MPSLVLNPMTQCDWETGCGTVARLADEHWETYTKDHPKFLALFFGDAEEWYTPDFAAVSTKVLVLPCLVDMCAER